MNPGHASLVITDQNAKAEINPVTDAVAPVFNSYNGSTMQETAVAHISSAIVARFLAPE
jgi:hypothetical protein